MDVEEVLAEVEDLRAAGDDDPESNHFAEDALLVKVLRAIADGAENARDLAAAALKTQELDQTRWYA